MYIDNIPLSSS